MKMRYLIDCGNHLFGASGYVTKDIKNDFDKYAKWYGFNSSEDAREAAEMLGITDANIIIMKI